MADSTVNPVPPSLAETTIVSKPLPKHKPTTPTCSSSCSRASPLSSHLQMVDLKHRILTSLNKLSDRDTHQIAIDELDKISQTLAYECIPMFLNCLFDAADSHSKPIIRKQSIVLLGNLSLYHLDSLASHLPKILAHIVKRLKDPDSGVREACQTAVGVLSQQYLREGEKNNAGFLVGLMVKPFTDALADQNKTVQAGSALCLARLVECAPDPQVSAFPKLCPRVCRSLGSTNFLAKPALLSLVSRLAQVGALVPQSLPLLLQSIHECLESSDWSTRKAAADVLSHLATHSSHLIGDGGSSTIAALEACRFDKVKPVRDCMTEALQLWKKVMGKEGVENTEKTKEISHERKIGELDEPQEKLELQKPSTGSVGSEATKDGVSTSASDSLSKLEIASTSDKIVVPLKKKPPILSNKELNPEFFQKLESRGPDDLAVEVILPRSHHQSLQSESEEASQLTTTANNVVSECNDLMTHSGVEEYNRVRASEDGARDRWSDRKSFSRKDLRSKASEYHDKNEKFQKSLFGSRMNFFRADGVPDNPVVKGNLLGIQRHLEHLEEQQANIMNMLQDFMGGSHDSMVTLENRVRGLERVVEDMARDIAFASGRRGSNLMLGFEGSSLRTLSKYSVHSDYVSTKLAKNGDSRMFSDRFHSSDSNILGARVRNPLHQSDATDSRDSFSYESPKSLRFPSRRSTNGAISDGRFCRGQNDVNQTGSPRGWEKGSTPVRLGEGPSARSVWQASKDEATLEAIRVAGEDGGASQKKSRILVPEMISEPSMGDNSGQEKGPLWATWSRSMDSLNSGDTDSAYADVLSTGDDLLLVKLMDISGPLLDQLSDEIAWQVLDAVTEFLQEQSLLNMALCWVHQLVDLVMENGPDFLSLSFESKESLLLSLHDASTLELLDDSEGLSAHELMLQLASLWRIKLQQLKR